MESKWGCEGRGGAFPAEGGPREQRSLSQSQQGRSPQACLRCHWGLQGGMVGITGELPGNSDLISVLADKNSSLKCL